MYESTINFTLDIVCPWTYLAKRKLDAALRLISQDPKEADVTLQRLKPNPSNPLNPDEIEALHSPNVGPVKDFSSKAVFTIVYQPFQLHPQISREGEDKREWYQASRYGNTDERMASYLMQFARLGNEVGVDYKFTGTIANTLPAHRVVQYFQREKGAETADKLITALYKRYFEGEKHPSSRETLLAACKEAGIDEVDAEKVVDDDEEGLDEVKEALQEQKSNGVDEVPIVVVEGRRRDITVQGAQSVEAYVKALRTIIKEST